MLPKWVRDKGIATQKELVMALMPYLEWIPRAEVEEKFYQIVPQARAPKHRNFNRILHFLKKDGLVEVKYGDEPPKPHPGMKPARYAYYRRISKTCPRNGNIWKSMLDGSYGLKAAKNRAKEKMPKKKPKHSVKHLTMDDVNFIRNNPHNMTYKERAEMLNLSMSAVFEIERGRNPNHLKGQLAR